MSIFRKHTGLLNGFRYAIQGFLWAAKSQLNLRIHIIMTVAALSLGVFLKISQYEWMMVFSVIFTTIVLELINTSLEQTTNAITTDYNPTIKHAKDVSAAAVFIYAMYALLIGIMIFVPKL
ncbi:MAG: diacylglycerol kinase family protein [Patescibacteria group bacterium]|jgi:undecaprenol kinase